MTDGRSLAAGEDFIRPAELIPAGGGAEQSGSARAEATAHSTVQAAERAPVHTRFLLFLAVLLVVNSHLEQFYPRPYFAGDGLIGYALFFFVSGLGLSLSSTRGVRSFPQYYYRRFIRIYPTVWLIVIPEAILSGAIMDFSASDYRSHFLWPTRNTFVGPIMVNYVILYFLLKPRSERLLLGALAALLVPELALWLRFGHLGSGMGRDPVGVYFLHAAYLQAMLLGAFFGWRLPKARETLMRDGSFFALTLFAYIALKYFLLGGKHPGLFPLLYLLTFAMLYWLVRIACAPGLARFLVRMPAVSFMVELLGLCCLEAYFVHDLIITHWRALPTLVPFPVNVLVLWSMVIPGAYLVERVASSARMGFRQFRWKIDGTTA